MKVLGCPYLYIIWTSDVEEMNMSVMMSGQPKRAQRAVPVLSWLTPLAAIVSVINVTISMCTGEWLKSSERIPVASPNVTHREEFEEKRTVSGLWSLCYSNINAVTKAGPLFIVASFLLLFGILSAALGYIRRSRRIATFVAGIIFIVAGLIMLIGLVVYLSVLQSEIGPKLRPRNSLDEPLFKYSYGFGFILIVIGFMSTEMTGICAIFWYIYWHQLDWAQKAGAGSCNNLSRGGGNGGESCSYTNYSQHTRPHHHHYSQPPLQHVHRHQQSSRQRNACMSSGHMPHHHSCNLDDLNSSSTYYSYNKINSDQCKRHGGGGVGVDGNNIGGGGSSFRCNVHPDNYSGGGGGGGSGGYRTKYPGSAMRYSNHFYYDDFDMDVPLPPPPPFPRDITCTTTVSADDFFIDHSTTTPSLNRSREREKEFRKTTPV